MSGCGGNQGGQTAPTSPATHATPPAADLSNDMPAFTSMGKIDKVTMASGLVIEEVRRGSGELCLPSSRVMAKYSCRTVDGEVFDDTGEQPIEFELDKMIRGWQEGLPGMQVGGVRRLTVPPALGYGMDLRDSEGTLLAPATSTLVFDVELVGVK